MRNILQVRNPNVYAEFLHAPIFHPLINIIHYDDLGSVHSSLNNYGVYGLFIQRSFPENLSYGVKPIRAADVSVIAVAPGQLGGMEDTGELLPLQGWAVLWSQELISKTPIEDCMHLYPFFSYFYADSLQLNADEWQTLDEILSRMQHELKTQPDSSMLRAVIISYLQLILSYCMRVYTRQNKIEKKDQSDILKHFDSVLKQYFFAGKQYERGLPTVAYCASEMAFSAGYFGDRIRRETGSSAKAYIQSFVIQLAKTFLMSGHNINETAYMLGFNYPHHFTRMFKSQTGMSPSAFMKE